MNIEAYINRINYKGSLIPNPEVLGNLQKAHLLNVPFENLDIHYHRPIILNTSKFYQKIVERLRGGFCYELNGLFNDLLQSLGFHTKIISARVYNSKNAGFGSEFDHLAILVELHPDEYLVDVGFGEFALMPLKFEPGAIHQDERGDFIIEHHVAEYFLVSKIIGETKTPEYIFTRKKRELSEFTGMCLYHQTSPDSHFTQKKLISRPTENGRITISGTTLKIVEKGETIEEMEFNEDEFEILVRKWFKITNL